MVRIKRLMPIDIYHEKGSRLNFEVKFDATPVTVTVAWNDFKILRITRHKKIWM